MDVDEVHLQPDGDRRRVDRRGEDVLPRVSRQEPVVHALVDTATASVRVDPRRPELPPAPRRVLVREKGMDSGVPDGIVSVEGDNREAIFEAPLERERFGGEERRLFANKAREAFVYLTGHLLGRLHGLICEAVPNAVLFNVHFNAPSTGLFPEQIYA